MNAVILFAFFVCAPAGVLWLCRKVKFFGKIGPILILYILGVLVGNLPLINEGTMEMKNLITSTMIPLAIPMLLFSCSFNFKDLTGAAKSLTLGLIASTIAIVAGYILFAGHINDAPKVAALLTGCETGGTINMASLQQMLNVPEEVYVLLNSYDMIVCFLYLIFLMSFGIRWSRKFLPTMIAEYDEKNSTDSDSFAEFKDPDPYKGFWSKTWWNQIWKVLIAVIICVALSFAVAQPCKMLFPGKPVFMPVFILVLTTLAIIGSFLKPVRKLTKSYDMGMYLIYIFSIAVASMADVTKIQLKDGIFTVLYLFFIVFVSLLLLVIFAKIFKVDADLTVITSVALVNSPPFVPMIASAMRNKRMLVPGITIGLVGFALGNYLGFLVYQLLPLLP